MPECVEGYLFQAGPLQYSLKHMQDTVWGDWTSGRGRKHVLAGGLQLHLSKKLYCVSPYRNVAVGVFCFQGCFHYYSILTQNLSLDADNAFVQVDIAPFQP